MITNPSTGRGGVVVRVKGGVSIIDRIVQVVKYF